MEKAPTIAFTFKTSLREGLKKYGNFHTFVGDSSSFSNNEMWCGDSAGTQNYLCFPLQRTKNACGLNNVLNVKAISRCFLQQGEGQSRGHLHDYITSNFAKVRLKF